MREEREEAEVADSRNIDNKLKTDFYSKYADLFRIKPPLSREMNTPHAKRYRL